MKHTPLTDRNVMDINLNIDFLNSLKDELVIYENGAPQINEMFDKQLKFTERLNLDEIKNEFWDLVNDFQNPIRLKNIYQVKFRTLLNMIKAEKYGSGFLLSNMEEMLVPFIQRHLDKRITISFKDITVINSKFLYIITTLYSCREEIQSILDQCDAYAGVQDEDKPINHPPVPSYRLASKRKTDFIKIMSAMYDTQMFTDKDGEPASNKQKLMEAFGEFLGDDFSSYSTSLSQAKIRDRKTFMKPFTEIEKAAERYLEE